MSEPNETALLPEGLRDSLVGEAHKETKAVEKLLKAFSLHGYDLILPPLVEFEESLLQFNTKTDQMLKKLNDSVKLSTDTQDQINEYWLKEVEREDV